MQLQLQSGALNHQPPALPLRARLLDDHRSHSRLPSFGPTLALREARHAAVRSHAFEQLLWLALALSSAGAVIVSFCR